MQKSGLEAGPPRITLQSRPAKRVAATVWPRSGSASYLCADQTLINQKLLLLLPILGESVLLPSCLPGKLDSPEWLPHPTVHFSSLTSSPIMLFFKGLWSFLRRLLPDALHCVLWSFIAVLLPRMTLLLLSTHENLVTLKSILKFSCSRLHRTRSCLCPSNFKMLSVWLPSFLWYFCLCLLLKILLSGFFFLHFNLFSTKLFLDSKDIYKVWWAP